MAFKFDEDLTFGSDMLEDDIKITLDGGALFKRPHCLVYTDSDGLLAINDTVLSFLSHLNSKLCIIGICGLYRTGKSYLMNWLAGDEMKTGNGFDLGATVQSKTKGIWIWCKQHPKNVNQVLILLDTEGLDDPEKGDGDHDNNLFCLTLLLSSALIINVRGVLDNNCFDKLSFIANLSDSIQVTDQPENDKNKDKNVTVLSPRLVMCIRDFHLKPEKDGQDLTPDEYLEGSLKLSTKKNKKMERFNKIKESITQYFPERRCFTLSFPANGSDLNNLESLGENDLSAKFVEEVKGLRDFIYKQEPKYICNASRKPLNGADLAVLLKTYVKAVRTETPITCEIAYMNVSTERNERILTSVIREFKTEMNTYRYLKSKQRLMDKFIVCYDKALANFREGAFVFKLEEYEDEATDQMKAYADELKDFIGKSCQRNGVGKLLQMYGDMMQKNGSKYKTIDGYQLYEQDMQKLEETFLSEMNEYDKDELYMCLDTFKSSKRDEKMNLYSKATKQADKNAYEKHKDGISQEMDSRWKRVLKQELRNRDQYLERELEELRKRFNELYKEMEKKKRCSIM